MSAKHRSSRSRDKPPSINRHGEHPEIIQPPMYRPQSFEVYTPTRVSNAPYRRSSGEFLPLVSRKSEKNVEASYQHYQHRKLKDHLVVSSDKHEVLSQQGEAVLSKKRSRQLQYIEDSIDREQKSSSGSGKDYNGRSSMHVKRNYQVGHPPMPRSTAYIEDPFQPTTSTLRYPDVEDSMMRGSRMSKQSFEENNYPMKGSVYVAGSSSRRNYSEECQVIADKFANMAKMSRKSSGTALGSTCGRDNNQSLSMVKDSIEMFEQHMNSKMEKIIQQFKHVQKKHLNLDLCCEELRQTVFHKKIVSSQGSNLSSAKQRQYQFQLSDTQSKTKQLKADNQRLQKQMSTLKAREDETKIQLHELQIKLKAYQRSQDTMRSSRKAKLDMEERLIEANSKILRLQNEKEKLQKDMKNAISRYNLQSPKNDIRFQLSSNTGSEHLQNSRYSHRHTQEIEYLHQKVDSLLYENKTYEQLISSKKAEVESLSRALSDNRLVMQKLKQINGDIEKDYQQLQKEKMQKQSEFTEKINKLNSSTKKKLKQYDTFKNLIVECLEQIYRQASKKIRKMFDAELVKKDRTARCEIYFKGITQYMRIVEQNNRTIMSFLQKNHGISTNEVQTAGLYLILEQVTSKDRQKSSAMTDFNRKLDDLRLENGRLKDELRIKQKYFDEMKLKKEQQEMALTFKVTKSQMSSRQIPSRDNESMKGSTFSNQELGKKKQEISRLNKQISTLTEDFHKRFLAYEEKITQFQLNQKKAANKILALQTDNKQLLLKLTKQSQKAALVDSLKHEKQALSLKLSETASSLKKSGTDSQLKTTKLENENETLKKKLKQLKAEVQSKEKAMSNSITLKQQKIKQLLEEKKKATVELTVLKQRLQFSKILEETKEGPKKEKSVNNSIVNISQNATEWQRIQELIEQNNNLQVQIERLSKELKINKTDLTLKDRQINQLTLELKRKGEEKEKREKENMEKEEHRNRIIEQYKKIIADLRVQKVDYEKKKDSDSQKKMKEAAKLSKELMVRDEQISNLTHIRDEYASRASSLQQKLHETTKEKDELVAMLQKRENQLQYQEDDMNELKTEITQLEKEVDKLRSHNTDLQRQLVHRQEFFKTSQSLMEGVVRENQELKEQLQQKEEQLLQIIKEKEDIVFKLSENGRDKSLNFQQSKNNQQAEIKALQEQINSLEQNLRITKQDLRTVIAENEAKFAKQNSVKSQRKAHATVHQQKLKQKDNYIEELLDKIDILEEENKQTEIKMKEVQQQLDTLKKQKAKYFKLLEEKYEYISQLEEALKIKISEAKMYKEKAMEIPEVSQDYSLEESFQESLRQSMRSNQENPSPVERNTDRMQRESLQLQNSNLKEEVTKLTSTVESLSKDNKFLKEKLQNSLNECQKIRCQFNSKQEPVKSENQTEKQLKASLKKYQEEEQKLNKIIDSIYADCQKKDEALEKKDAQLYKKIIQNEMLLKENKKLLKERAQNQSIRNSDSNEKEIIAELQSQAKNQYHKNQELEDAHRKLTSQVNRVRLAVQEKEEQINKLQELLKQSEEKVASLIETNECVVKKLQKQQDLNDISDSNELLAEYKNKYEQLSKEFDEQNLVLYNMRKREKENQKRMAEYIEQKVQQYKNNLTILEKQIQTYKEMIIDLTEKCQALEKEGHIIDPRRSSIKMSRDSIILARSPGNNEIFNSVDLGSYFENTKNVDESIRYNPRLDIMPQTIEYTIQSAGDASKCEQKSEKVKEGKAQQDDVKGLLFQKKQLEKENKKLRKKSEQSEHDAEMFLEKIKILMGSLNEEQDKSQQNRAKLTELFKQQMSQEKQKSDKYLANLESIIRINEKLLEIWFSKENLREDLEDYLEHLQKLLKESDPKVGKRHAYYLSCYDQQQELFDKARKKGLI